MSEETNTNLPEITDPVGYMDQLTFHPDLPAGDVPTFDEGDELLPRSFKVPRRLDNALQRIADERGVTKSDVIREALEVAVVADLASKGEDVLIPLADALRALTGLRHLPRTA
jgi:hypothetical protein